MPEGFGFIRCDNYMPGDHDIYVAPAQIRRFNLKTGDIVKGNMKVKSEREIPGSFIPDHCQRIYTGCSTEAYKL